MKIVQIGQEDWSCNLTLPEDLEWLWMTEAEIPNRVASLKAQKFASLSDEERVEMVDSSEIDLAFDGLIVTDSVKEEVLSPFLASIEAYAAFTVAGIPILEQDFYGFCRKKCVRELPPFSSYEKGIQFLYRNLFTGQYGAKLKIADMAIHPQFEGKVSYDGNVGVTFEGEFGADFESLFTYRYNVPSFSMSLELWPEYVKVGNCQVGLEVTAFVKGSLGEIYRTYHIEEADLDEPYVIESDDRVGYYAVSIVAKGSGVLTFGATHWRYSREGLGRFVLGGQRKSDSKRQEIFSYFNPGDLKPPLNVYFSGFRGAEGFEGFYMMKSMQTPFLLIADPRLEGGCFYAGTAELEEKVRQMIQDALDYLQFDASQLILSGLSMGAFGALYYAAYFQPFAVLVGKPFTNLGDVVANLKLKRPDEFETSSDMMRNVVGGSDQEALERFNHHFWKTFAPVAFEETQFAIAYMEHDDYDRLATKRLLTHLADRRAHVFTKGYEGRHNDNSRAITQWFMAQYEEFLQSGFGRKLS